MGVFIGIQQMEYGGLAAGHITNMGAFAATGSPFSVAAGRISYTFGLRGPAVSHLPGLEAGDGNCGQEKSVNNMSFDTLE